MKLYSKILSKTNVIVFMLICCGQMVVGQDIHPKSVKKEMKRVANWQIAHFRDTFSGREKPHHIADWTNGALYVGMVKYAEMSKTDRYYKWLKDIGEQQDWKLHYRKYHADDHVVGQMYVELFRKYGDSAMIKNTIKSLDYILENPSKEPITLDNYKHLERWTWCDALFMGPPLWAKIANITGEQKYNDFMMKEYQATYEHLFDEEESLFYRDNSYIGKLDGGKKIFWSRGNGWVFGGLTLLMDEYEEGSKEYEYFKDIYLRMAKKLIEIQTPKGHWAMSLLNNDLYPTPETSGTSFFTFGLAWGVNKGLLEKSVYEPHIKRAWHALTGYITKDGMLGYVQPIGAAPGKAWPDKSEVYGSGAFLAAGSEVYKLYGGQKTFQIKNPDYKKSPKTGMTREHWKQAAMYMLEGAFSYVNDIDDPMKFPKMGDVGYPHGDWQIPVEKLEGLCRTLFVAVPLLKENPDLTLNGVKVAEYYRHNILNLLDEKHPSFIKTRDTDGKWPGQTLVEFGALSISLFSIPEIIWDPLTQEQKDALAAKMLSYGDGPTVPSNWKFFNIYVLSFFKDKGYKVNEPLLKEYLQKTLDHYRGDGWYNDNPAYDYYSMWAFQMYAPYWVEIFGKRQYPEISEKFKQNFCDLKKNYPYFFAKDGKMNMWGRSITYRFASVSPFPFFSFYENELKDNNWGWDRRIYSGVLLQFLQNPNFMVDNVPALGFYGSFDPAVQYYSCRGGSFWMGKAFLGLLTPEDSEFWQATENDGAWEKDMVNDKANNRFYEESEVMVTNYPEIGASEIRAWCNVTRKGVKKTYRSGESYNKLSYNTAFPWQADDANGTASMNYVFTTNDKDYPFEPGHLYDFKTFENEAYHRTLTSEYIEGVKMQLTDIPLKNGILRVDKVETEKNVSFSLGHYALSHINGFIKEEVRSVNDTEVHIIDNGEYQLALVPVYGWDEIETITSQNLHPESTESTVINVSKNYQADKDKPVLVTALLWKPSGEDFSDGELTLVEKVKFKKKKNSVTLSLKSAERTVNF